MRVAEIYPLKRLPRRMGFFDYNDADGSCGVGDLVEISLRKKKTFGIVAHVFEKDSTRALMPVGKIMAKEVLTPKEIEFFEALAKDLIQSPASILNAAIPTPPKRTLQSSNTPIIQPSSLTLPADEAPAARETIDGLTKTVRAFVLVPDLRRTAALVAGFLDASPNTHLTLLAPNVRDAQLLAAHLERFHPAFISGEETNNERFRAWQTARTGTTCLLIGTRLASLLPLGKDSAIWITRSGHPNHKNADQNPRYDARAVASLSAANLGHQLILSDAFPRPEISQLSHVPCPTFDPFPKPTTIFADRGVERRASIHSMLGSSLLQRIEETLEAGKKVLCVYNRLGTAAAMRCAACGFGFPCSICQRVQIVTPRGLICRHCKKTQPLPKNCPHCDGRTIEQKGFGNRAVADALQTAFPGQQVAVIEKDAPTLNASASIILATHYWLETIFDPFLPSTIGLIALLDADAPLRFPGFRASEQALLEAAQWRGAAHACRADFLLQTDNAELFKTAFSDPWAWSKEELAQRISYHQPPSVRLVRLTCHQFPAAEARHALQTIVADLQKEFPSLSINTQIQSEPGTFSAELMIAHDQTAAVFSALQKIDDACVIDTIEG